MEVTRRRRNDGHMETTTCMRSEAIGKIVAYKHPKRSKISRYKGDKKSQICPCCESNQFVFKGRYKQCLQCGFHNFYERKIRYAKRVIGSGQKASLDLKFLLDVAHYIDIMRGSG